MKVLQINSVCGYGSTGRIVVDLYNTLKEHGHDCKIAYGRGVAFEGIDTIKIGNKFDIYLHVLLTRLFDKHGFGSKRATKNLIKEIEKYNPDIIHLHNIHGYYINIEVLFKYLAKSNKKVIWTLHDCWALTGHCAYFDYAQCDKWKKQCSDCIQKNQYPDSLLDSSKNNYNRKRELFTSIKNMQIVTPSKWLKNIVKQSYLKKYEVSTIYNGIDLNNFKPQENNIRQKYNLENKKVILGVASKWEKRKGLDTFIKLANILDNSYKIVLIGISDKEKSKIPSNIITIKRTNNVNELAQFYTMANVFLNPTLEDNFPTTNIESLACGTPVITFRTGGSPEAISENCGIIVEKGNVNEIINAIERIVNTSKPIEQCVERAKEYDKHNKYKEYIEIYKKFI